MSYRIGFASIDGTIIDQHFGSARYWQIYDVDTEAHFVETRKTAAKCQGHCEGGFEHLISVLNDCDAIFVLKIGEPAAAFMLSKGKRVFEAAGEVDKILAKLIGDRLLEDNG
ncbi:dinitrogenase iron-molybdenum cofactor biosynthesis [[Clostridium] cellulosi]|uniref:Dinitrogenase iron-molybdenum cofactor biosynthesis n=1 Tax=[Clostridium] cellulosi TaxID=29343 RepID=A0A078KS59_9FIRM|nr:dinitrogenase iron-molybdenum cofactor biosynthesis [[Clostridium] cellulosi]